MSDDDAVIDLARSVEQLPATDLVDVEYRARLQARTDRKYVVPISLASRLIDANVHELVALEIDGQRAFGYSSQYWDTPERRSYHSAAGGRRRRFKVRNRTYENDGATRLEVKTRGPRGRTEKASFDLTPETGRPDELGADGAAFVERELNAIGLDGASIVEKLEPVVTTSYRRSTLVHPTAGQRTTIDHDLSFTATPPKDSHPSGQASGPSSGEARHRLRGFVVIETKSPGSPTSIDRWLWRNGARPDTVSKYAVAMALFDPSLGAHKWARVLRDHFDREAPGVRA